MLAGNSTAGNPSNQFKEFQASCLPARAMDASETPSTAPISFSPTIPPPSYQRGGERGTSHQAADDAECPSSASSHASSDSLSSITTSPSSTHSSPTADTFTESHSKDSPHSDSVGPYNGDTPMNPISKRTAELCESRRTRQRYMSHPPISPSTTHKRGSTKKEGLQHIAENEPVEFHSTNSHELTRGRSHQGLSRNLHKKRPQMDQRKSTSATLRVALHVSAKDKIKAADLDPLRFEEQVEKKAAIVAATAAAWAVKQNRAQANAGSDKRFNLQVREGSGPSFDIIQTSVLPSPPSPAALCDQKQVVNQQPGLHPVMSASQNSLATSSTGARDWSSGRYSADEHFGLAACCPGVAYARNKSRLAHLEEMNAPHPGVIATANDISTGEPQLKSFFHPLSWASCLAYTFLSPLCLSSYSQSKHRAKTRKRYGIGGDGRSDCTASLFCGPCELARESREIVLEEDSQADAMDRRAGVSWKGVV
ncbi:hypothetical protein BJ165DRAFT_1530258 [Panaeolus papilionaceus]|nr:hypothetical protein BJ165DRAFT_1530258 [Panaeolus papilionaceus]